MDFTMAPQLTPAQFAALVNPFCYMARVDDKKKGKKARRNVVSRGANGEEPPLGGMVPMGLSLPGTPWSVGNLSGGEDGPPYGGMMPGSSNWLAAYMNAATPSAPGLPKGDDGSSDGDDSSSDGDSDDGDEKAAKKDGDKKITVFVAPFGYHPERSRTTDFPCFEFEPFELSEKTTVKELLKKIGASWTGATVIEQRGPQSFVPREVFRGSGSVKDVLTLKNLGWTKDKVVLLARAI